MINYQTFTIDQLPDSFPLILGQEEYNKIDNLNDFARVRFSSPSLDHLEKLIYFYLSFFPASLVYLTSRQSKSSNLYIVTIHYEMDLFQEGLDELHKDHQSLDSEPSFNKSWVDDIPLCG
jgi:hypothetical protein